MASADAIQLGQIYLDFVESVNRLSTREIPVFHKENFKLLILRESQLTRGIDSLKFGAGADYGPQPSDSKFTPGTVFTYGGFTSRSDLYYFSLPSDVVEIGATIMNRPDNPSAVFVRNTDFIVPEPGIIAFKDNPFENSLLSVHLIAAPDGTTQDREILLWMTSADIETHNIYTQFGFIFSSVQTSSEFYRILIEKIFLLFADGPSLGMIDSFVAAAAGQPVVMEAQEVVQSIDMLGSDTLVVTDHSVYRIPDGIPLRESVYAGATLAGGTPLTAVTAVYDRASNTRWWTTEPALALTRDSVQASIEGFLGFFNQIAVVTYMGEAIQGRDSTGLAEFSIAGLPKDVETFWQYVHDASIARDQFLGPLIWRRAGAVLLVDADDGLPKPDYEQVVTVNPIQFLVENLIGNNLIVIKINMSLVNQVNSLLQSMVYLRQAIPAHTAIIIFIRFDFEDELEFQPMDGSAGLDLQDSIDLIKFAPENFSTGPTGTQQYWLNPDGTPTDLNAEAIAVDIGPDMINETFDLSDPASVVEDVQVKYEKVCR
jgi:hypothetical protein